MQKFTKIYQRLPKITKSYQKLPKITKIYQKLSKVTKYYQMLARAKRLRAECHPIFQGKTSLPIWPGQNVSAKWHPGQNVTQGKTSQGRMSPNPKISIILILQLFVRHIFEENTLITYAQFKEKICWRQIIHFPC